MLVGSAGIYLSHPVIRVGSIDLPGDVVALQGSTLIATERHLHLAARAQAGLVRVRLWSGASPVEGVVVFEGSLRLDDGVISVCDVLGTSSFRHSAGAPGNRRLLVSVDDPGKASRIDIALDPGTREVALTSCPGYPLPGFRVVESAGLDSTDELGLILSDYNILLNRLAAALKLIRLAAKNDKISRRSIMMEFRVRMVGEWLRWISPTFSEGQSSLVAAFILESLQGASPGDVDSFSVDLSRDVMSRVTV